SRRRHTRSKRDWSSDVCSSDLKDCGANARPVESARVQQCLAHVVIEEFLRPIFIKQTAVDVRKLSHGIGDAVATILRGVENLEQIGRASCRESGQGWEGEREAK